MLPRIIYDGFTFLISESFLQKNTEIEIELAYARFKIH